MGFKKITFNPSTLMITAAGHQPLSLRDRQTGLVQLISSLMGTSDVQPSLAVAFTSLLQIIGTRVGPFKRVQQDLPGKSPM